MSEAPFHVGYVVEPPYPSFVVREIRALRENGVRVTVFNSFRPFEQDGQEAESLRRESYYFPHPRASTIVINGCCLLRWPLRYARLVAAVIRERLPWRLLLLSGHYAEIVRRRRVQHLHAMYATTSATIARLASALCGVPFSFTAHAYDIYLPNPLLSWTASGALFVTTISAFNRDYMLKQYNNLDPAKIRVVYLGTDTVCLRARQEPGESVHPRQIVSVAALLPCKGHLYLLRAHARLLQRGHAVHLTLVGDGEARTPLEEEILRLGLQERVTLAGAVPHEAVWERLKAADAFVLPCIVDDAGYHDGLPVALMEAMAVGVPVVSTRVSGIPELVQDGVSGLLVPERDPDALASAVARLLEDPGLWRSLSQGGRARVEQLFNLSRNAQEMAALFRNGAGNGRSSGRR